MYDIERLFAILCNNWSAIYAVPMALTIIPLAFINVCVSQCIAACHSVLRSVAVCCTVLHCVAVCCSVLQCVALCCSVLWCVVVLQCVCSVL